MQRRLLGKTGERLSVVGFGGIVVDGTTPEEAARVVGKAIDRGVNYFDVAPTYGNAEERLGPALKPYRDGMFLACKTIQRSAREAREELARSLRRLETDRVDLYQLHGVSKPEEVEQILDPGGALEALLEAKEKGQTRFIGFSAHTEEAALALLARGCFDTVMFPLNCVCWHCGHFGPRVVEAAQRAGAGLLALKALARRRWRKGEPRAWRKCWYKPIDDPEEARLALRFTLSLPVTAAPSPSHAELLWLACDAAAELAPLPEDEAAALALRLDGEPLFSTPMG